MNKITRKVYQNNSNGQLLVTIPKTFRNGDEVEISLSKSSYEVILDKSFLISDIYDKESCEFMKFQIQKLFTKDLEDFLCNNYLEETIFESWEGILVMGVNIDFKINVYNKSSIGFNLRLTKRKNYDAPNREMIKKLKELLSNKDLLREQIEKYLELKTDFIFD